MGFDTPVSSRAKERQKQRMKERKAERKRQRRREEERKRGREEERKRGREEERKRVAKETPYLMILLCGQRRERRTRPLEVKLEVHILLGAPFSRRRLLADE